MKHHASPSPEVLAPISTSAFATLGLHPALLAALVEDEYEIPTPIQVQAIPPVLAGRDLLGIAQTGTGKTAAFALPILHHLLNDPRGATKLPHGRRPRVLVLTPTRELAAQIGESFARYGRNSALKHTVIFGGVGQGQQVRAISAGVDILVATPGRLLDLIGQGHINLGAVTFFVLDEADRMLDMGFIQPIRQIAQLLPAKRQTMLFSATMPREIQGLAEQLLTKPTKVAVTPAATIVEKITQSIYGVTKALKVPLLVHLLQRDNIECALVFTKTKHGADRVVKKLRGAKIECDAIHGNKAQNQRTRALDAFRQGHTRVLVATDIAARGLDIDGITHVFNFDLPMEPEAYVHRIGRTARAGASGIAIAFCDQDERGLLRDIERITRQTIERIALPENLPQLEPIADEPREPRESQGRRGGGRGGAPRGRQGQGAPRGRSSSATGAPTSGAKPAAKPHARARDDRGTAPPRPHARSAAPHTSAAGGGHRKGTGGNGSGPARGASRGGW